MLLAARSFVTCVYKGKMMLSEKKRVEMKRKQEVPRREP